MTTQLLQQATAYIWAESDMLDYRNFADWLDLWTDDGLYIVPIDPEGTDFDTTLNYAHDDKEMRRLRVGRLTSGESISTDPAPRTVRLISRLRIVCDEAGVLTVRCAQFLSEYRKDVVRYNTANIEYRLARSGDTFKIQRKLVRLINSDDAQVTVGYIF